MKTRCVNPYEQSRFYHLNRAGVRRTQTMPKQCIRKDPTADQDKIILKARFNVTSKEELSGKFEQMLQTLESAEKERKQLNLRILEHDLGRHLSEEEKQEIMVYL